MKDYISRTKDKGVRDDFKELISKLPDNAKVLDLGIGAGNYVKELQKQNFLVDAVEKSDYSIEFVKNRCGDKGVEYHHMDMRDFDIKSNHYDLIITRNSIPFIPKEDGIKMLNKIKQGLKQGGYIYLSLFGYEDGWKDQEGMGFYSIDEIKDIFSGFNITKLKQYQVEDRKKWDIIEMIGVKD